MKKNKLYLLFGFVFLFGIIFPSCSSDSNPVKSLGQAVLTQDIKSQLDAAADSVFLNVSTPGMIALVSAEGEEDYIIRRGVSNITTGDTMNENYYFRIASNTKTFTGLAVLMLVDEGKINLDSSISYYFPERNIPNGNLITIRMLGNMTSGLFNYSEDEAFWATFLASNFLMTYSPDTLLAISFRHSPNFLPGTSYEYCNTNTILLGLLMEKITGMPASQILEEKIIRPLNMNNTHWPTTIFLLPPYIHGYNSDFAGSLMDATNWNPSWGYTAGALISKFSDLKIWAKVVAEGKFLSEKTKSERFKWIGNHYGFCVMKAGNWVGHPGSIFGYNSHVFYNSVKKVTLIILTNMDTNSPVEYFSNAFRNILDK